MTVGLAAMAPADRERRRVKAGSRRVPAASVSAPIDRGRARVPAGSRQVATASATATTPVFEAGRFGRSVPGALAGGPNSNLSGVEAVRRNVREQLRNNPLAFRVVDSLRSSLVGSGYNPNSRCGDADTERRLDELWADWSEHADAAGALDFAGLTARAVHALIADGEAFVRLRPRRTGDLPAGIPPVQLELIEADQVSTDTWTARNGNRVVAGVERDAISRVVAYHVWSRHPRQAGAFGGHNEIVRVPGSELLHLWDATRARPGQERGDSALVRVLVRLGKLDEYDDGELSRKKLVSALTLVVKSAASDALQSILPDDGLEQYREAIAQAALTGSHVAELEHGSVVRLLPDEELQTVAPAEVGGSYEPFLRAQMRAIASGAGLTYPQLSNDWSGISDRALRLMLQEHRRQLEQLQGVIIHQLCRPVWRRVVDVAALQGLVSAPSGVPVVRLHRVDWSADQWPDVHPVQDRQGDLLAIGGGLESRRSVVRRRGGNIERVDRENFSDNERASTLNLKYEHGTNADDSDEG